MIINWNWERIFDAVAEAYNLTPHQLRELLQALTDSRIIRGYRHPVARYNGGFPYTPPAA